LFVTSHGLATKVNVDACAAAIHGHGAVTVVVLLADYFAVLLLLLLMTMMMMMCHCQATLTGCFTVTRAHPDVGHSGVSIFL